MASASTRPPQPDNDGPEQPEQLIEVDVTVSAETVEPAPDPADPNSRGGSPWSKDRGEPPEPDSRGGSPWTTKPEDGSR